MALQEWVNEDSAEYEKIMRFNDPVHPLMHTAPGEKLDCVVDEAYAYETKDGKVVIGVVPRVQAGIYLIDKFELAGEYVINDIVAQDAVSNPTRYLIRHRQLITLDDFNHIIDLNRPDVLDPQTIFDNVDNFKGIVHQWAQHHWISDKADKLVQDLSDGHPELIDERIPRFVAQNAGFKRALSEWREKNWISEMQARQFAKTGQAIKTLDDELSFAVEIN